MNEERIYIHGELLELVRRYYDQTGVRVTSANFNWALSCGGSQDKPFEVNLHTSFN